MFCYLNGRAVNLILDFKRKGIWKWLLIVFASHSNLQQIKKNVRGECCLLFAHQFSESRKKLEKNLKEAYALPLRYEALQQDSLLLHHFTK